MEEVLYRSDESDERVERLRARDIRFPLRLHALAKRCREIILESTCLNGRGVHARRKWGEKWGGRIGRRRGDAIRRHRVDNDSGQ